MDRESNTGRRADEIGGAGHLYERAVMLSQLISFAEFTSKVVSITLRRRRSVSLAGPGLERHIEEASERPVGGASAACCEANCSWPIDRFQSLGSPLELNSLQSYSIPPRSLLPFLGRTARFSLSMRHFAASSATVRRNSLAGVFTPSFMLRMSRAPGGTSRRLLQTPLQGRRNAAVSAAATDRGAGFSLVAGTNCTSRVSKASFFMGMTSPIFSAWSPSARLIPKSCTP